MLLLLLWLLLLWFINKNCSIFSLAQQHSIMKKWKKIKSNSRMIALILVINARICLYVLKICCWNPNRTYMIKHDNQNIQTIVQLSMFCCGNWAWFKITVYDYCFFLRFCCFIFVSFVFLYQQTKYNQMMHHLSVFHHSRLFYINQ